MGPYIGYYIALWLPCVGSSDRNAAIFPADLSENQPPSGVPIIPPSATEAPKAVEAMAWGLHGTEQ